MQRRRRGGGGGAHNKWTAALIKRTSQRTFLRTCRCILIRLLIRPDPFQLGRDVTRQKRVRAQRGAERWRFQSLRKSGQPALGEICNGARRRFNKLCEEEEAGPSPRSTNSGESDKRGVLPSGRGSAGRRGSSSLMEPLQERRQSSTAAR